jgi:hypothetical protein
VQQTIGSRAATDPTEGGQANAKKLLTQPIGRHHRSQTAAVYLLLKGGLGVFGNALKQAAEAKVLQRLKRRLAAAMVKAEIEPLGTHAD